MTSAAPQQVSSRIDDAATISLVGLGHGVSHYFHLILAPLVPWLRVEFGWSYAQIGLAISVFFVASALTQAVAGVWVDRHGPLPVLLVGLGLLAVAAFGLAVMNRYEMALGFSALAGVGNGVFHPADYTLLNRKVQAARLGHAYSVHSISGNLGAAAAPAVLVLVASLYGWRAAYAVSALIALVALAVV